MRAVSLASAIQLRELLLLLLSLFAAISLASSHMQISAPPQGAMRPSGQVAAVIFSCNV
jgi:hypothetical protein